jgi:hypothetical protein
VLWEVSSQASWISIPNDILIELGNRFRGNWEVAGVEGVLFH